MIQERLKKFLLVSSLLLVSFILICSSFSYVGASSRSTIIREDLPNTAYYSFLGGSSLISHFKDETNNLRYYEFTSQFYGDSTSTFSQGYTYLNSSNSYTTFARSTNGQRRFFTRGDLPGMSHLEEFNYYRFLSIHDYFSIVNKAVILPGRVYTSYKQNLFFMIKTLSSNTGSFSGITMRSDFVVNLKGQKYTITTTYNGSNIDKSYYLIEDSNRTYGYIPLNFILPDLSSYIVDDNIYLESFSIELFFDNTALGYDSLECVLYLPLTDLSAYEFSLLNAVNFSDWVETPDSNPYGFIFKAVENFLNFEFFPGFRFSYILMFGLGVILIITIKNFLR